MRWISTALFLLSGLFGMAHADTPLSPPADFVHETPDATVRGSVERNRTTITQHGVPHSPTWAIPVWARFYSLSPTADAILVLAPGGNLLDSRDPDQIVMTVWYLEGDKPQSRPFRLAEVMNPADMPRTVSHYAWLTSYVQDETGWRLRLADGRKIIVTYR
ncbi:hypothetical protein [Roseovarius sp. 2305UL8-3]|uniref:hypothetical protein n=1 Tax=Roseovarius conchicola TaxID=3121636 RepID=UPI0035276994